MLRYSVGLHGVVEEEAAPRRRGVASKHVNVASDVDNSTDAVLERKKKYQGTGDLLSLLRLAGRFFRVSKILETSRLSKFRFLFKKNFVPFVSLQTFFLEKDS